jgi:SSS family solute:Na+ symporter
MLSVFFWHVCTGGSDQMAIQRYMATRDVKAARRTLAVSLSTDFVVLVFLGLLGLALLAFFSSHPDRLPDGQTIYGNADKLFPRFVVVGLPLGFSGLVIAGLLAAAMSSLSSGVNSSSAVISQDIVQRLRKVERSDAQQVRLARAASIGVGVIAVLLSTAIGQIQGNMLEVVYKVVNLFVAPLFFLFFMAIFVPWATTLGTWIGAISAVATAITIAFWGDFTGGESISFLCIMPGSLMAGILIGCVCSFVDGVVRRNPT